MGFSGHLSRSGANLLQGTLGYICSLERWGLGGLFLRHNRAMFTLFLLGNIASGKSYAARYLEAHGALRIDLDQLAKDLYQPGSQIVAELCERFCYEILAPDGTVRRAALAKRAFSSPENTRALNEIVHPYLLDQLALRLLPTCCTVEEPRFPFAVVEVSAPDSFDEAFSLADEVMVVTAPCELRRERAVARGMASEDFERRDALLPPETALCERADIVIDNAADVSALERQLDVWLASHHFDKEVFHGRA